MVVRRSAAPRKPCARKDGKHVIGLFVEKMRAKTLVEIALVMCDLEPCLRQGEVPDERAVVRHNDSRVPGPGRDDPEIPDEPRDRRSCFRHCGAPVFSVVMNAAAIQTPSSCVGV